MIFTHDVIPPPSGLPACILFPQSHKISFKLRAHLVWKFRPSICQRPGEVAKASFMARKAGLEVVFGLSLLLSRGGFWWRWGSWEWHGVYGSECLYGINSTKLRQEQGLRGSYPSSNRAHNSESFKQCWRKSLALHLHELQDFALKIRHFSWKTCGPCGEGTDLPF